MTSAYKRLLWCKKWLENPKTNNSDIYPLICGWFPELAQFTESFSDLPNLYHEINELIVRLEEMTNTDLNYQRHQKHSTLDCDECLWNKEDSTNPKDLEGNKKPPLSLVPASVIIHLAEAFKEGAKKYGAYNWRTKKVQAMIYLDAALRHILATVDGEDIDPESGKHHLDGALASLAVYIDAMETGNLIDNRPPKGTTGELIRKIGGK